MPEPTPMPEVLPPAPDIAQPFPQRSPTPPSEPAIDEQTGELVAEQQSEAQAEEEISIPPHLVISSPFFEQPRTIYLERRETTIGHAGSSDVLLNEGTLTSRHHALLRRDGDHYYLYDSRSTHGVFVNSQQIPCEVEFAITDGDHINIGEYELAFHFKLPMRSRQHTLVQ